jgi:predicted Kef-type K+ transport protein
MEHGTTLIATIALAFAVALLFGVIAARLRLPPIVGYLLAGVAIGMTAPTLAADGGVAAQASEMGVVLLMFGVGLHFSLRDLMAVRAIVVPGALLQIAITGTVGTMLGRWWGLSAGGAMVLGLSLAVASTVVVLKGLEARDRSTRRKGGSPSGGSSSKISRWCWCSCCCPPLPCRWAAPPPPAIPSPPADSRARSRSRSGTSSPSSF